MIGMTTEKDWDEAYAFYQGYQAFLAEKYRYDNPYTSHMELWDQWDAGYQRALNGFRQAGYDD
jgi:ribosome modulation factor